MAYNEAVVRKYADKGLKKYERKKAQMVKDYVATIPLQNQNYADAGFGSVMTNNYTASADERRENYTLESLNSKKWYNNYISKASMNG